MGNSARSKLAASVSTCGPLGPSRKGELIQIALDIIQERLVGLATEAVEKGEAFSAVAILRKSDLSLVGCGREATTTRDPTATAELNAIQGLFALRSDARPAPKDCVFLCMHEPSAMALYQIAQCGFDNFVFLFTREEAKEFGIEAPPVSMKEIFTGMTDDGGYNAENSYWTAVALGELIENCDKKDEHKETVENIKRSYQALTSKESLAGLGPDTPIKTTANA